jgi:hypothetical protein
MPISMAALSKAWVYGRLLTGIVCSNLAGGMDVSHVSVVCCQVEVSATSWSLVQRSPTECGVSECDREALKWGGLGPQGAVEPLKKKRRICYPFWNHTEIPTTPKAVSSNKLKIFNLIFKLQRIFRPPCLIISAVDLESSPVTLQKCYRVPYCFHISIR